MRGDAQLAFDEIEAAVTQQLDFLHGEVSGQQVLVALALAQHGLSRSRFAGQTAFGGGALSGAAGPFAGAHHDAARVQHFHVLRGVFRRHTVASLQAALGVAPAVHGVSTRIRGMRNHQGQA